MSGVLTGSAKSYACVFGVGILVGCVCRLADFCSYETLWGFASIQTMVGFWIISNTVIVLLSSSNACAGISSFLYMFGMTLSFYGLQAALGTFVPLFSGGFRASLFVMFSVLSVFCAIVASVLYFWNKDNAFSSVLYALPVGALAAEAVAIMTTLEMPAYLFQLSMDIAGSVGFFVLFYGRSKNRPVLILSSIAIALLCYVFFPW